jgi:hypothetical protein
MAWGSQKVDCYGICCRIAEERIWRRAQEDVKCSRFVMGLYAREVFKEIVAEGRRVSALATWLLAPSPDFLYSEQEKQQSMSSFLQEILGRRSQ